MRCLVVVCCLLFVVCCLSLFVCCVALCLFVALLCVWGRLQNMPKKKKEKRQSQLEKHFFAFFFKKTWCQMSLFNLVSTQNSTKKAREKKAKIVSNSRAFDCTCSINKPTNLVPFETAKPLQPLSSFNCTSHSTRPAPSRPRNLSFFFTFKGSVNNNFAIETNQFIRIIRENFVFSDSILFLRLKRAILERISIHEKIVLKMPLVYFLFGNLIQESNKQRKYRKQNKSLRTI